MSTQSDEIPSVKPSRCNQVGDVVKGRTCRKLNVTRKIIMWNIEPANHSHVPGNDAILYWISSLSTDPRLPYGISIESSSLPHGGGPF